MEKTIKHISCYTGLLEDNSIYLADIDTALLLEYNIEKDSYEILENLLYTWKGKPLRIMSILKEGDSLFLILRNTYNIYEYCLKEKKMMFHGEQQVYVDSELVGNAFLVNKKVYILPSYSDGVIQVFDIETKEYIKVSSIDEVLRMNGINLNQKYFIFEGSLYHDKIYTCVCYNPYVLIWDCLTMKMEVHCLMEEVKLGSIFVWDEEKWLTSVENNVIYKWDGVVGTKKYILHGISEAKEQDIVGLIPYGEYIVVLPRFTGHLYAVDEKNEKVIKIPYPASLKRIEEYKNREFIHGFSVRENRVYLYPCSHNGLLILNMDKMEIEMYELLLDKQLAEVHKTIGELLVDYQTNENSSYGLKEFFLYKQEEVREERKEKVGKLVYKNIKG